MKILIADDHPVVRQGLKAMLAPHADMEVIGDAKDGQEALELARTRDWDVAVVDYSMPGQSGEDLVRRIKQYRPEKPVLVLSMHPEELHAIRVMKAGASGYVNKDSVADELAVAIRKVASGGRYVSPSLAEKLVDGIGKPVERPLHEQLSDREYRVLRLLAAGKPIHEIGKELFLSPSTVSTYRTHILRKLKLSNNADLVRYSVENGLAA